MIGKTISHYKIVEKIGGGGMGVVYKAHDTTLDRFVALKFLPQNLNQADEEKQRFIHEARAASALDHHNICNVHEIGEAEDGQLFIAMALYEGQMLDEKIEAGPLKLTEAVDIAVQISEGLAKAHGKEIVHRDLKPANVVLTEDGVVKILDFGLAKLRGQTKLTKEGTTLGTVAYMSPEQGRGEEVDQRTDIFSLGVLIYEMVTGQQPFKGEYEQAVLYSIMNEVPEPLTGLRTGVPLELERVVLKCLQKSPDERYQSAGELLVDLRMLSKGLDASQSKSVVDARRVATEKTTASNTSKLGLFALGAVGLAGLVALFLYFQKEADSKPIRLTNPQKITQAIGQESWPTWSPDGTRIAYQSDQGGKWDIWVKQLAGGEPINLTRQFEDYCGRPSWSPDGSQIAFISRQDGSAIWIVPAIGGTATRVAPTWAQSNPAWSPDGNELAHVVRDSSGLPSAEIYSLATHAKRKIALPGEEFERDYLSWSPQGDFFAYADADNLYPLGSVSTLRLVRISDGRAIQITTEEHLELFPCWSLDSRLLYFISTRGGTLDLWQVKLNDEGDVDGNLVPVTNGLNMQSFAFSRDHTKVALAKEERRSNLWRIAIPKPDSPAAEWANAKQLTFESSIIVYPDLSPDGKRIYFGSNRSGNSDIWSMPAEGGELRQLTTTPEGDSSPSLSPDGNTIAFKSARIGKGEIWTMPAAGGPAKQITDDESPKWWPTWCPDGQTLAYASHDSNSKINLYIVPAQGGEPKLVATGPNNVFRVLWWPDGQSLVSIYNELDHFELRRFPIAGGRSEPLTGPEVRVSTRGLRWSADRTEIYFFRRGGENRILNIWSLSVADGSVRQLTDLQGRPGRFARVFANYGTYLYFPWVEETADIWVMDVERE